MNRRTTIRFGILSLGLLVAVLIGRVASRCIVRNALEPHFFDLVAIGDVEGAWWALRWSPELAKCTGKVAIIGDNEKRQLPVLAMACRLGDEELVRALLANGAKTHVQKDDCTALNGIVESGSIETMELLLTAGANADGRDIYWRHPMECARTREKAALLLKHGASNHLYNAMNVEVAELLITHCADVNIKVPCFENPSPVLHEAARREDPAMVMLLVKHGARVNAVDAEGVTVLDEVVWEKWEREEDRVRIVRFLVENGAAVNGKSPDYFPLCSAIESGSFEIVKILVDHGANVNIDAKDIRQPLFCAASNANPDIVKLLISRGADINVTTRGRKRTVLHCALAGLNKCEEGCREIVRLLLKRGLDAKARDADGDTPLHLAAQESNGEAVAEILIAHGADVNAVNGLEWTPLHQAAYFGNSKVARVLIRHGADVNAGIIQKYTPLHAAIICGDPTKGDTTMEINGRSIPSEGENDAANEIKALEVATLLVKHGAQVDESHVGRAKAPRLQAFLKKMLARSKKQPE